MESQTKKGSVYKDAAQVSIIIFALGFIELLLFFMFAEFKIEYIYGCLYGCLFASLNFFYLAYSVKKSVEKSEKAAKAYMSGTYSSRIFLTAVMIFVAAKLEVINIWAAVIPLIFPRVAIFVLSVIRKRGVKD